MNNIAHKFAVSVVLISLSVFATPALSQVIGGIGVGQFAYQGEELEDSAENDAQATADSVMAKLQSKLNTALIESRKFMVYGPAQLDAQLEEQKVNLEGFVEDKYKDEQYALEGLDYLLVGELTEYGMVESENEESGKTGVVEIDFELIGSTYGTLSTRFDATASGQDENLETAMTAAVDEVVATIMFNLFPLRVMTVSDEGVVKLNYGQGVLQSGDTVRIFAPVNPSGNGAIEGGPVDGEPIATVQVISVDSKFSSAQILDGADQIQRGLKAEVL